MSTIWAEQENSWGNRAEDRDARTLGDEDEDERRRAGEQLEIVETQACAACT